MFFNQCLIAEAELPVGLLFAETLYGFLTWDKVSHVEVERVKHIVIRNATFYNVINIVRLVASAHHNIVEPISIVCLKCVVCMTFYIVIQLEDVQKRQDVPP